MDTNVKMEATSFKKMKRPMYDKTDKEVTAYLQKCLRIPIGFHAEGMTFVCLQGVCVCMCMCT